MSLSVIVWLSHVSVPMRMSGSDTEMKLPSSAVLFFILWKLNIDDFERFLSLSLHCCCGLRDQSVVGG